MPQTPLPPITVSTIKAEYLGEIVAVTMTDSARLTFDAFVEFIKMLQADRPSNEITYFMYDFRQLGAGFQSPYGRAKITELTTWRPELVSYSALILQKGFVSQIGRAIVNNLRPGNSQTFICFTPEEAKSWLDYQFSQHGRTV
jgi:hypothetical protein